MSISKPVLDNVVLRVMAFAHPRGLDILLSAIQAPCLLVPGEVYSFDEDSIPLDQNEDGLSELAKGLRYAARQVRDLPQRESARYQTWLQNSEQLSIHQKQETLKIQYLTLEELEQRYKVQKDHRIGRGESACIILAKRYDLQAVFLSSDQRACQAAAALGINPLTIPEILDHWITLDQPSLSDFDELLEGMRLATFTLKGDDFAALRSKLTQP